MTKKVELLVVDDQMGVRRLLFEAFRQDDYNVELAGSGLEAIDKIKQKKPDVILMDMKMPGMNGLETLKEIKKLDFNPNIIMMTAYGEVDIVSEAMNLGVKEYVTKPFDINELREMVKKVVENSERPVRKFVRC
ncbi:response regulator [Thermincola potens]|uniref:Stage 0 sporulation protein A homolog n=1 Tax=Thermincola potens (strain JR) TaxID=635013 RepID=D5XDK5_THEPJ|nr:response regulator [Thermincola potens]ADG83751.1 response regulator receiver protein [Thermincola potens JR]